MSDLLISGLAVLLAQASVGASPLPSDAPSSVTFADSDAELYRAAPPEAVENGTQPATKSAEQRCQEDSRRADPEAITICAERPNDAYRINPDVSGSRAAYKAQRQARRNAPVRGMTDTGVCERSGGCRAGEVLDWVNVALVAGSLASRLAAGESVKDMVVTRPEMTEYEFYKEAKRQREEREAEEAAAKVRAEARAKRASVDDTAGSER